MENPFELILERLDRIEKAIDKINSTSQNTTEINSLMNIKEVAYYLNITISAVYGLTHRRKIPNYKVGKKLYFKKEEIDNWILSKRSTTVEDVNLKVNEYLAKNPLTFR
jgi:excisionase family DNA binding protein